MKAKYDWANLPELALEDLEDRKLGVAEDILARSEDVTQAEIERMRGAFDALDSLIIDVLNAKKRHKREQESR